MNASLRSTIPGNPAADRINMKTLAACRGFSLGWGGTAAR